MPADSFTAFTLLQAHSLHIFFVPHLPPDFFNLEDALPLPHEDADKKSALRFLFVQSDIFQLDHAWLGLVVLLVVIGLDVIDDLLLALAIAILFGDCGNIVFLLIYLADLLTIDETLPHLFPEVEILVLDLVLYFLDDRE